MFLQQHEEYHKRSDLEARVRILEDKLGVESFKETLQESLKENLDEWLSSSLTISCIKEEMDRRYKRSRSDLNDYIKESKKSEKEIKDIQETIASMQEEQQKAKNFTNDILIDLKLKAYTGDLNRVERILDTKCSLNTVNDIISQIKLLATNENLDKTRQHIQEVEKTLEAEYFKLDDAFKEMERIQEKLAEKLLEYSSIEFTTKITQKIHQKLTHLESELQKHYKASLAHGESTQISIRNLAAEVSSKVSGKDLEKISQELLGKASKLELTKYLSEISPKISDFYSEISSFRETIRLQENALQRFDEILLQKASKVELQSLGQKISLVAKHADIEYKIDDMLKKQVLIQDQFNDIEIDMKSMSGQLNSIQAFVNKKSSDAIDIKFLKDSLTDIQTSVSYKADRTEILNFLEQKAELDDVSHLSQGLESVHMQIKLLAVQVGAFEKLVQPNDKTRDAQKIKREYFNKVTNRLVSYIVGSKPAKDEQPISEEIKAFLTLPATPKTFEHKRKPLTPSRQKPLTPSRRKNYSFDVLSL